AMQLVTMRSLSKAAQLFQFLACLFGVRWNTRLQRLQYLQLLLWFCWYIVIGLCAVQRLSEMQQCRFDCLIAHTLFLMLTSSHIIILMDTFLQRSIFRPLCVLAEDRQASRHIGPCIWVVLLPNLIVHLIVVFRSLWLSHVLSMPLFWIATPSSFGLQLKLYSFLYDVLVANVRVVSVQQSLKVLARQSLSQWLQSPDVDPVKRIKQRYNQLNQLFAQLNSSYGLSLLIIFIALFLSFVFNTYWLVSNILTKTDYPELVYMHLGVVVCLGMLFATICWHCQQSSNHSRQIGCLISKLVKPSGCKRYNDLICEFMLQTLHQRFVVTAKDFFNLNLHLLSSMCAAVVTYLVILIENMFAENRSTPGFK
ncbi:hypothetical protein KR222_003160, partial [Zaprionus bogoriensis]